MSRTCFFWKLVRVLFLGLLELRKPTELWNHHILLNMDEVSGESWGVCASINNQLLPTSSPDEQIIDFWQFKDMKVRHATGWMKPVYLTDRFWIFLTFPPTFSLLLPSSNTVVTACKRESFRRPVMFNNIPTTQCEHRLSRGCSRFIFEEKKLLKQLRTPKRVFLNYFFFIQLIHLIPKISVVPV